MAWPKLPIGMTKSETKTAPQQYSGNLFNFNGININIKYYLFFHCEPINAKAAKAEPYLFKERPTTFRTYSLWLTLSCKHSPSLSLYLGISTWSFPNHISQPQKSKYYGFCIPPSFYARGWPISFQEFGPIKKPLVHVLVYDVHFILFYFLFYVWEHVCAPKPWIAILDENWSSSKMWFNFRIEYVKFNSLQYLQCCTNS